MRTAVWRCWLRVRASIATGQPFQYTDACVARDLHVGGDREATAKAAAQIDRLLRQVFAPR